ncbi:hypothetical protein FJV46_13455 [Arthrobacter agilis]|uniref:hypothetical protein n=1 Tax=Arthrobacter agilis TaxID=37921 RepID=UPI000B35287A|nr:hypothetical protein [Arthrobacter agilis]OUM44737.1 hypothetical protein B8W74_02265 [Arthrobacter agilis]PPB47062.1 hypothetical protein CI784_03295 [Arthrobacter agilis]TPV22476.1 hypothetical protein FJV46_13455 [Arthrobacter agilis]VDR32288.1 Uncharacterised protein [Arthrobacter agilis]
MTAFLRALPGLTALSLVAFGVFLPSRWFSSFLHAAISQQAVYTASHIGSALLYVSAPIAFALIGKGTNCQQHRAKAGTVLLSISVLPHLAANIMDLATTTPQDVGADIGGALLMLLGLAASLITSLVFTFVLPLAGPADADRMDNSSRKSS